MSQYTSTEIAIKFTNWKNESKMVKCIEEPSILKLIGNLNGKTVIDYGCGAGHYTRLVATKADKVVGVDQSEYMIEYAKSKSTECKNIEYYVNDCAELLNYGQYDIALSVYFLPYAKNKEILKKFLLSMFHSLKLGGICCGLTLDYEIQTNQSHSQYQAIAKRRHNPETNIDELEATLCDPKTGEKLLQFINYLLDPVVIEETFKEVGFINFKWVKLELSNEYKDQEKYFEGYFSSTSTIMYYAEKPI